MISFELAVRAAVQFRGTRQSTPAAPATAARQSNPKMISWVRGVVS
jgi:hypothetical protein